MAPDYAQAVAWYRKGAEQSHNLAQYNLGRMYRSGTCNPADSSAFVANRRY
ncbi:hypothetical protein MJI46_31740 [Salmonella enterica subsp. enterica serovar Cerro]|nr:hypothetical protein [Salmonella enterica subsp. enterica serovar Cerro]